MRRGLEAARWERGLRRTRSRDFGPGRGQPQPRLLSNITAADFSLPDRSSERLLRPLKLTGQADSRFGEAWLAGPCGWFFSNARFRRPRRILRWVKGQIC